MKYYILINTVVIYIESRIRGDISYKDLERITGFSLVHIRSIFKRFLNISLAKYILQRKISNAAYEIKYSNKRITDIAYSYGFEAYDSFTRAFKRTIGVTPQEHRINPCKISVAYISSGVYAPIIHKEECYLENEMIIESNDCVIFGVPVVDFGYGVNSTFPSCLKACLDYLEKDISYDYIMASCGAAYRLRWNTHTLDLGNVNIMNLYEDEYRVFELCFNAVGQYYKILKREASTTKSDFVEFITKEIKEGRPCIGIGIIGPPEACVITGYRNNGEELLGYSLFQNEPQFCKNTTIDASGYFVCSDWWENNDTKAVISIGESYDSIIDLKEMVTVAIRILSCNRINQYASGQAAYDAVIEFMSDDTYWSETVLQSKLVEQVIAFGDIMVMMCNRKSAVSYFEQYEHQDQEVTKLLREVAEALKAVSEIPEKMTVIPGGWDMSEAMIKNICKLETRKQISEFLVKARNLERTVLGFLEKLDLVLV